MCVVLGLFRGVLGRVGFLRVGSGSDWAGSDWVRMSGFSELNLIQIELGWGGMHGGEIASGELAC